MKTPAIFSEADYLTEMNDTALPWLNRRKEELSLEREPKKAIYCVKYTADAPKGTVVISHGFTESADKYPETAYYLTKAGYHTYIPEHCGHGRSYRLVSDPSLVHTDGFRRYVEDLLLVARTAKDAAPELPLYLYGHSMGGGIAAAAAASAPELFRAVVLSSPMIRPATGGVPWTAARFLAALFCLLGKQEDYVIGHHPYDGKETFPDSAAASEPRFSYYDKLRKREPLFQTNAASYGWLHGAARLSGFLMRKGWKQIQAPVLLFQAETDSFVCASQQELFVQKLNSCRPAIRVGDETVPFAQCVRVPRSKHEIFNSETDVLEEYWGKIFQFLEFFP